MGLGPHTTRAQPCPVTIGSTALNPFEATWVSCPVENAAAGKEPHLLERAGLPLHLLPSPESKAAQAQAPPGGVLLVLSVPGILEHSLCQLMWLTHCVVFHPELVVFFF